MRKSWKTMGVGALGLSMLWGCSNSKSPEAAKEKPTEPLTPTAAETSSKPPADAGPFTPPPPPNVGDATNQVDAAPIPPAPVVASDAAGPSLKKVDLDGFEKWVAEQKGKVVAVDCWATWCVPCREKFPKFAHVAAAKGDKVVFASLSFDDEAKIGDAEKFLADNGAKFAGLWIGIDALSEVGEKYKFDGIPRYFVFDAAGALALNTNDVAEVEAKLAELAP